MEERLPHDDRDLVLCLLQQVCQGAVTFEDAKPVLTKLLAATGAPSGLYQLVRQLESTDPDGERLAGRLRSRLLYNALLHHNGLSKGQVFRPQSAPKAGLQHLPEAVPIGWRDDDRFVTQSGPLAKLVRDRCFLWASRLDLPVLRDAIEREYERSLREFAGHDGRWSYFRTSELLQRVALSPDHQQLLGSLRRTDNARESARLHQTIADLPEAGDEDKRRTPLDRILTWPCDEAAGLIPFACDTEEEHHYGALVLMVRFGQSRCRAWSDWTIWLQSQADRYRVRCRQCHELMDEYATELLL